MTEICVKQKCGESSDWIQHPARGQTLACQSSIDPERFDRTMLSASDAATNL